MDFLEQELDPTAIVFRDALFFMLFSLVVVIFLISFLISTAEPKKDEVAIRNEIVIEASWPSGTKYDVDLWCMGPDKRPVGWGVFSQGAILNLERDDRGMINDTSELNYELTTVRKRVAGEYIVNLHMYNDFKQPMPLPVKVRVIGKGDGEIYSGEILLERRKQEHTVIRFTLDEDGSVLRDTINDLQFSILSKR